MTASVPQGYSCMVTGGLGGLGLLSCHEMCKGGYQRVVAISRSGHAQPYQEHLVDAMLDETVLMIIKADLAEASVVTDILKILNSPQMREITEGTPDAEVNPPEYRIEDLPEPGRGTRDDMPRTHAFELMCSIIDSLKQHYSLGGTLDYKRLQKAVQFRDKMSAILTDSADRTEPSMTAELYQRKVEELNQLISLYSRSSVEMPVPRSHHSIGVHMSDETVEIRAPLRGPAPMPTVPEAKAVRTRGGKMVPDDAQDKDGVEHKDVLEPAKEHADFQVAGTVDVDDGKDALFNMMDQEMSAADTTPKVSVSPTLVSAINGKASGQGLLDKMMKEMRMPTPDAGFVCRGAPRQTVPNAQTGRDRASSSRDGAGPSKEVSQCDPVGKLQVLLKRPKHVPAKIGKVNGNQEQNREHNQSAAWRRAQLESVLCPIGHKMPLSEGDVERCNSCDDLVRTSEKQSFLCADCQYALCETCLRDPKLVRKSKREFKEAKAKEEEEQQRQQEEERRVQEAEERKAAWEAKFEAERQELEKVRCPANHILQSYTAQKGFPCDVCNEDANEAATFWGCREYSSTGARLCGYDICNRCREGEVRSKLKDQSLCKTREAALLRAEEVQRRRKYEEAELMAKQKAQEDEQRANAEFEEAERQAQLEGERLAQQELERRQVEEKERKKREAYESKLHTEEEKKNKRAADRRAKAEAERQARQAQREAERRERQERMQEAEAERRAREAERQARATVQQVVAVA